MSIIAISYHRRGGKIFGITAFLSSGNSIFDLESTTKRALLLIC